MTMEKKSEAENILEGNELYMEYLEDAKKVKKSKSYYDDFDYEVHLATYYTQEGMRKGLEQGLKQGQKAGREEEREKEFKR